MLLKGFTWESLCLLSPVCSTSCPPLHAPPPCSPSAVLRACIRFGPNARPHAPRHLCTKRAPGILSAHQRPCASCTYANRTAPVSVPDAWSSPGAWPMSAPNLTDWWPSKRANDPPEAPRSAQTLRSRCPPLLMGSCETGPWIEKRQPISKMIVLTEPRPLG